MEQPPRSVRARVVLAVVSLTVLSAAGLAATSYLVVASSLSDRLATEAVEAVRFTVVTLLDQEDYRGVSRDDEVETSGLGDALRLRGTNAVLDFGRPGDEYATRGSFLQALTQIDPKLPDLVANGRVVTQRVEIEESPWLVAAARRPPEGPDVYVLTDAADIEEALARLRTILAGAVGALAVLAGLGGWRIARLAGSLDTTVRQLVAARARERRFVADVSHELRTPLTALVNEAAGLQDHRDALPADGQRLADLLARDVGRLRHLVEDLLELSRLDAATEQLEITQVDVARFLEAVVAARLPDATLRAPAGITARTDRRRIERIVGNLLDNARSHAPGAPVEVRADLEDGHLRLEVVDRGPGVPDADLERIFDRFHSIDSSRAAGSGLGLAIVAEQVSVLGGEVRAANHEDGGLVVTVRLPVAGS